MTKRADRYHSLMFKADIPATQRLLIGIPTTGLVRMEWVLARYSQTLPCNWSHAEYNAWINQASPIGYAVAEARNIIVDVLMKGKAEWLLFIDHDVILPPDAFVRLNEYMSSGKYPVVSGLYFAKAHPPEPLVYRGRGNSFFRHWTLGEKVWVDGVPMGCTMIHRAVMEPMWKDAEWYLAGGNQKVKRVFDTPAGVFFDAEARTIRTYGGTEDLAWCNRVMAGGYLKKAGWPQVASRKYPFLIDTAIFCRHITNDGVIYPFGVEWLRGAKAEKVLEKSAS